MSETTQEEALSLSLSPLDRQALDYHARAPAGKLAAALTKPCDTREELSLAYTPGVAAPCRAIQRDPEAAWRYTGKGNLVAVISNCTAVLGLGDIGPLAGKPVMEGKALLFKRFADVDACDIEVDRRDVDAFCDAVEAIAPTFGGINLEDVKAPQCFEAEERLRRTLDIPVFHDDQHGTAIVTGAALINALSLAGKRIGEAKFVFLGAGAAGLACARFYLSLGMRKENAFVFDREGLLRTGVPMNPWKAEFALDRPPMTLAEAMAGADVFVGLSSGNQLTAEMIASMAPDPIVFALANPTPEIAPELALAVRDDLILSTGRSDYPNQVNNVLGFPGIFRGALDTRAKAIGEEMKRAASEALAALAREERLPQVIEACGGDLAPFGKKALLPSPLDPRVVPRVALAVARAAMETGAARQKLDLGDYERALARRLGLSSAPS